MRIVPFQYLALATAILSCSSVYAADLEGGAVAAPDQYGAQVAADILKKGGNAVDAAVATAFTLAVTYPEAGNIGGGGFMTLFVDGKPYFLDYREVAPKAATRNMYLDDKGEVIENLSLVGVRAAGVPGTVMGLWEAHRKFGKLPWSELLTPAIGYAKNGFKVAEKQYQYRNDAQGMFKTATNFNDYFGNMKVGELFRQPELAQTLERIAAKGVSEFYQGKTADLLVAQMQADKGLITKQDLQDYKAVWREPMAVSWRGNVVYTAPPPSSGGVALAQLLGIKEDRAADFKGWRTTRRSTSTCWPRSRSACSPTAPTISVTRPLPKCRWINWWPRTTWPSALRRSTRKPFPTLTRSSPGWNRTRPRTFPSSTSTATLSATPTPSTSTTAAAWW